MSAAAEPFDIAIVGGGPVGATLGCLLASGAHPRRIAILDRQLPAAADAAVFATADAALRVSALSRASERILDSAGAWPAIAASRICPYEYMHVWAGAAAPRGDAALRFDAAELGEPNLGVIVANEVLQLALLDAFRARDGSLIDASVQSLCFEDRGVVIGTSRGSLRARLLVGADGARSAVRALAGMPAEQGDYGQSAVVAQVRSERGHERTAWQRFLGYGTLALLPRLDGAISIVWSVATPEAQRLAALAPAEFNAELTQASAAVLGALTLASDRQAFPLRRLSADDYAVERCVLIGDAAHVVHPLAGQGVNLGLMDAAVLAELLDTAAAEHEDPGAIRVLRRFERARRADNERMMTAIDAFNRFLSFGDPRLLGLAQRGLRQLNRVEFIKRLFAEQALGTSGRLPRVALS